MRVMLLGGTRFIGRAVVRSLMKLGHDVWAYHRGSSNDPVADSLTHVYGERTELPCHRDSLAALQLDAIVDMRPITEAESASVLTALSGMAPRFVAVSSIDVYRAYDRMRGADPGPPDPVPLTEDSPLRERLYPYRGDSPRAEDAPDRILDDYDKIPIERRVLNRPEGGGVVIRLPMVYGPNDYQHRLDPYLRRMDDGRPHLVLTEREAALGLARAYVEDAGLAIALCAVRPEAAGRVYHSAETGPCSEIHWIRRIAEQVGWSGRIIVGPDEVAEAASTVAHERQDLTLNTERIRTELGFSEATPADAALSETIAWERQFRRDPPAELQETYAREDSLAKKWGHPAERE